MSARLDAAIARVKAIMSDEENDINKDFEKAANDLFTIEGFETIGQALLLLDDKYDLQDLMWLILHLAEDRSAGDYVQAYLAVLPELKRKSPEWAARIMARCLNSGAYRTPMREAFSLMSPERQGCVIEICEQISKRNPQQFADNVFFVIGK